MLATMLLPQGRSKFFLRCRYICHFDCFFAMKRTSVYLASMLQFSCQVIFSSSLSSQQRVNLGYRNWKIALRWWFFHSLLLPYFFARAGDLSVTGSKSRSPQPRVCELSCVHTTCPPASLNPAAVPTAARGAGKEMALIGVCQQTCCSREKSEQGHHAAVFFKPSAK